MTTRNLWRMTILAAVIAYAAPATAQTPSEFSAGWNFVRSEDENYPKGWFAEFAGNLHPLVGIVGQLTGNYKSLGDDDLDAELNFHSFAGGVRINARGNPGIVPFAHALIGVVRSAIEIGEASNSETDPLLQLGGGVNIMGSGGVGLRLGGDYVRIMAEDEGSNAVRFSVGVVIGF